MKKFKRWLIEKFLPTYCRNELLEENKRLSNKIPELQAKNDRLNAYIDGMESALRYQKITIRNEVTDR